MTADNRHRAHHENASAPKGEPVYPYADEPWASYYLHQNPGWATPRDGYSRWKLATSRKATAIQTWKLRELARAQYEQRHGQNPVRWPTAHPTLVVYATNVPTPVCLRCKWIDGSFWDEHAALTAGELHQAIAPTDNTANDLERVANELRRLDHKYPPVGYHESELRSLGLGRRKAAPVVLEDTGVTDQKDGPRP